MSTATIALEHVPAASAGARPSFGRLTGVELRKMVDTRAGFWLQLGVVGLTIASAIIQAIAGHEADHTLRNIMSTAVWPAYVLLPVVGILLVSSEWSQRTTLVTFSLVPQRWRVFAAKLGATVPLAAAATAVAIGSAVLVTAITAPAVANEWHLPATVVGQTLLLVLVSMIIGVGWGASLLSTPAAIVASFALPIAWSALGSISALEGAARWFDAGRSLDPMTKHVMDGTEWARVGTTLAVWLLVPLVVGMWRIARSEIK